MKLKRNLIIPKIIGNERLLSINKIIIKSILLIYLLSIIGVNGLYEDQVSKFDWKQPFVGHFRQLSLIRSKSSPLWQTHNSIIISTNSRVLSSLHLRNGTIEWRHVLESNIDSLISGNSDDCHVMTINGFGNWIRCWTSDGLIVSEKSLPHDYIEDIENNIKY
jgi:hypothetical protein